jgi:hypothetical protein
MIRILSTRTRDRESEDLEERYRGFVSLPKNLLPRDEGRSLDVQRWVAKEAPPTSSYSPYDEMEEPGYDTERSQKLAQVVIPIPRTFPFPPPLLYERGGRRSPPRRPGPQSPRRSSDQCYAEYQDNLARCDSYYPKGQFPGVDLDPRGRGLCKAEAFRVYSDCETGRNRKPFDPTLFYEE